MKITRRKLKQIIEEEMRAVLAEGLGDDISKLGSDLGQTARRAGSDISQWAGDTADTFKAATEVMPGGEGLRAALRHKKEVIHQEILNYLAFEASKSAAGMAGALVGVLPGDWEEEEKELENYVRQSITRASPDMAEWITSGIVGEDPNIGNCPPCKKCDEQQASPSPEPYGLGDMP
mgnify:CR=1 FL=1|tara:strand:+ start:1944 stop:2474 length:531 start_codon:yes stop_codon:yes gene_type:complete